MSYAIIRNEKYTKDEMNQLTPHNERYKKKYSNRNIDLSKTSQNYHLKKPIENTYYKEYKRLIKKNNLYEGQIHKNSVYACEMILTSDSLFFDKIGREETKRYFKECYNFVSHYQGLGEENIISAVVHLDEESPHMHLVYIPVIDSADKVGNSIRKVNSREFWKGKSSYKKLQDEFYKYITNKGFDLERGKENTDRKHLDTDNMKNLTNFYDTKTLKSDLRQVQNEMINYSDVLDFYKYEDFTKNNVDKKLILPMIRYNEKLVKQNNNLLIELSKVKNARKYYYDLEQQFLITEQERKDLETNLRGKNIELNACYDVIKDLLQKNEKMQKILKNKLGINFDKEKNKTQ